MKVLNLYAGIGGNRKLWPKECEVTAVENNPEIAKIYKDFFPDDVVLICDAHEYLLKYYKNFDFIWSSRPCQSHSRARYWGSFGKNRTKIYPDMGLYEEIIFLKHYCKDKIKYVVENVKPYYNPLIKPTQICGRHLFWANFDLSKYKLSFGQDNRVIIRNIVEPKLSLHIFNCAFKVKQEVLKNGV